MISNAKFLSKAFTKIDQIDKKNLVSLANGLERDKKLLTEVLDAVQEGVLIILPATEQILYMNLKAKLMLSGNSDVSQPYGAISKIISDPGIRDFIHETVQGRKEIYEQSYEILEPAYLPIRLTIQQLWRVGEVDSEWNGSYGVFLNPNTAKREQAEEEQQLERRASILSLASGIAHELGNPLNSIGIHLQLLSKELDKLPSAQKNRLKKSIQIVMEETERLDKIVRNFLKAVRRRPIQFELGNIRTIIQDVLTLFHPQLRSAKIKTVTEFDSLVPRFFMDVERMNLVFTNVVKNATQAMPEGGKLSVTTKLHKNSCAISIADTGVGISKSSLPKVFDAYYTTKDEGNGLGLVIAYQIIREHGGRIEIKSEPGKGSVVNILLPIRKQKLSLPGPNEGERSDEQFI